MPFLGVTLISSPISERAFRGHKTKSETFFSETWVIGSERGIHGHKRQEKSHLPGLTTRALYSLCPCAASTMKPSLKQTLSRVSVTQRSGAKRLRKHRRRTRTHLPYGSLMILSPADPSSCHSLQTHYVRWPDPRQSSAQLPSMDKLSCFHPSLAFEFVYIYQ